MQTKYQALFVAPDGDYVIDYKRGTIQEVIDMMGDRGSRWYFYPFEFVIIADSKNYRTHSETLRKRIVDHPYEGHDFKGRTVNTVLNRIRKGELDYLMEG